MRYVLAAVLLIVLIIIVLIAVLLLSKATVRFAYREDGFEIKIRLLCFSYTYDSAKPKKKKAEKDDGVKTDEKNAEPDEINKEDRRKSIGYWIDKLKEYYQTFCDVTSVAFKVLKALRYKIEVLETAVQCVYGTGDAAQTGIAYGFAWAAVSQLYVLLRGYFIFDFPKLELTPVFDKKCFSLSAQGIIRLRPVHIIKAAIVGLITYYRRGNK